VSLTISPGSRQVMTMLAGNGALADIISAGARILECGCGPCIGMGQAPRTDAVSVRTFNRNFYGRTGTYSAGVYLTSVETAAATALTGVLTDPRDIGLAADALEVQMPKSFLINDNLIAPPDAAGEIEVVRGPNIKPFPQGKALENTVTGEALLKMEDNITTDHISPAGAKLLPYRSNIPYLSDFCLAPVDPTFPARAKEKGGGFLVAGHNYGQGSSREHAALVPLYLGIRGVIAKSFARIHMANLVNSGILPLTFEDEAVYDRIEQGDVLAIADVPAKVDDKVAFTVENKTKGFTFGVKLDVSDRLKAVLMDGGLLNHTRKSSER
jgi:aconitate hydratase